jgi:hypothetical protein
MTWCRYSSGTLETRPRYNSKRTFYPFPFPASDPEVHNSISEVAEDLDKFRKERQATHPSLTLTSMYNVLEKIKDGRPLSQADQSVVDAGQILSLVEYHDRIDALALRAYGWPTGLTDFELLERLVALNSERDAAEKKGEVHWLRPDYQMTLAQTSDAADNEALELVITSAHPERISFPSSPIDQASAVAAALLSATGPIDASTLAVRFKQGQRVKPKIASILEALVRTGAASTADGGRSFSIRRAA